jgi:hypothetical protein
MVCCRMQTQIRCLLLICRRTLACLFIAGCLSVGACSDTSKPPFIKAQVLDVYNNKTDIYNAHFHYQWQERGETAFLDTNSLISRELMATIVEHDTPGSNSGTHALRIHLKDIHKIEWKITDSGKKMYVYPIRGPVVQTQCLFPEHLRVDPASGLAEYSCSIIGNKNKLSHTFDFRLDLDFIKSITITEVDSGS